MDCAVKCDSSAKKRQNTLCMYVPKVNCMYTRYRDAWNTRRYSHKLNSKSSEYGLCGPMALALIQARIQGGGARVPCPPPPIFWGKIKGAKNHTHRRKKRSKSDNHEARYRLKRTTKHTKYANIFLKKNSCLVGGGGA